MVALTGNEIGEVESTAGEPADFGTRAPGAAPEASHDVSPAPAEDTEESQPDDGLAEDSQQPESAMPTHEEPETSAQAG